MRISDWSSDVCSSDLAKLPVTRQLEEDQQDAEEDEDARCDHGGFLLHARECARAAGIWRVAPGNIGCGVGPLRSQTKNTEPCGMVGAVRGGRRPAERTLDSLCAAR